MRILRGSTFCAVTRCTARCIIACVLPVPAPARTESGRSTGCSATSRWRPLSGAAAGCGAAAAGGTSALAPKRSNSSRRYREWSRGFDASGGGIGGGAGTQIGEAKRLSCRVCRGCSGAFRGGGRAMGGSDEVMGGGGALDEPPPCTARAAATTASISYTARAASNSSSSAAGGGGGGGGGCAAGAGFLLKKLRMSLRGMDASSSLRLLDMGSWSRALGRARASDRPTVPTRGLVQVSSVSSPASHQLHNWRAPLATQGSQYTSSAPYSSASQRRRNTYFKTRASGRLLVKPGRPHSPHHACCDGMSGRTVIPRARAHNRQ